MGFGPAFTIGPTDPTQDARAAGTLVGKAAVDLHLLDAVRNGLLSTPSAYATYVEQTLAGFRDEADRLGLSEDWYDAAAGHFCSEAKQAHRFACPQQEV